MKLRRRLLMVSALTLATGMAVLGFAANVLLASTIHADQRQRAEARAEAITASLSYDRGRLRVDDTLNDRVLDSYAWIVLPDGRLLEHPSGATAQLTRIALSLASRPRSEIRSAPAGMVLASLPLRVNGHQLATVIAGTSTPQLQRLRRAVLIGSIVGALAILLVGALLIHRALAAALEPVERMTRDAEEWGDHDLDRRFNLGPPRDEISSLAMTLDHLLARISASRRHEQRFAAEVAHELRTPLAALRGTAELAQRAPSLDQARDALARIEAQSLRLSEQLDALMAQIRREPQGENHTVLKDVVAEFAEIRTITSGDPDAVVEGEPALVRQMLAPLIENARRHASESVTVEIRGEPDQVSVIVRDDGPGVEPGLGGRVFLPGIRGTQAEGDGAGLGLPLALRLAASFGGQITLGDGPGGCFILSLPRVPHSG